MDRRKGNKFRSIDLYIFDFSNFNILKKRGLELTWDYVDH